MSKKIDFFIIGAQKSATTSLYEYLNSIDIVSMPLVKEMQVFTNDELYKNFPSNLPSFYCQNNAEKLIGMADVEILYAYEKTAKRIYDHNRNAKIIIMLRNPIDRAYSSYWFSRKNQRENIETFEKAIALEDKRKKTLNQNDRLALTYLDVSMYYKQVKKFIDIFGEDHVLVLIMEEFIKDKEGEFAKVLDFLEIENDQFDKSLLNEKFNEGGAVKNETLQAMFNNRNIVRNLYSQLVPLKFRMLIRNKYINPLLSKNSKNFKYDKLSTNTRAHLTKYFNDDVENLSKLLRKDLNKIWF